MSKAPRTTHDDFAAIDRYVAATFDRFQHQLVVQLSALEEPRVTDPDRAIRRLRCLVETLAGFAVGSAIGAVASAARRGYGEPVRDGVGRVLGRVLLAEAPRSVVTEHVPLAPFLRDPQRPLLDALGARLLARLCIAAPQTRAHLAQIHAEIARAAPDRLPAFAEELARLAADDSAALTFGDQLASGWRFYAAGLVDRAGATPARSAAAQAAAQASIADARGTWRTWTTRLSGPVAAPEPTHEQVVAQGYLMRIA